jgi:Tol biopolymer transport system component
MQSLDQTQWVRLARLSAVLALAVLAAACTPAPPAPTAGPAVQQPGKALSAEGQPPQTAAAAPLKGVLVHLYQGDLWALDLATKQRSTLVKLTPGKVAAHVAGSPDGARLAYIALTYSTGFRVSRTEVIVANRDGSDPRPLLVEEASNIFFETVAWGSDSRSVFVSVTGSKDGRLVQRLDRVTVDGQRSVAVEPGMQPVPSPTGADLAYVQESAKGWSIWLKPASGEPRVLVPPDWFIDVDAPTFRPDGSVLAFAASGSGPTLGHLAPLLGWADPPVAYAHGEHQFPFDLWLIQPDGKGLQRAAELNQEQPALAWSPDGQRLAIWGGKGLQVFERATGKVADLDREPGAGSMVWMP